MISTDSRNDCVNYIMAYYVVHNVAYRQHSNEFVISINNKIWNKIWIIK